MAENSLPRSHEEAQRGSIQKSPCQITRRNALRLASGIGGFGYFNLAVSLSPPAPPPPTIGEIVGGAQTVFVGRVESVAWKPIFPELSGVGSLRLGVQVTDLLLGDTRFIPTRITYIAGRVSMSEAQAKAKYEGNSFVFAGGIRRQHNGDVAIVRFPNDLPFELSKLDEFIREIARGRGSVNFPSRYPGTR